MAKSRGLPRIQSDIKVTVKDGSLREAFTEVALPQSVGSEYLSCLRQNAVRYRERQTKARALSVQVNKMFSPLQEEVSCRKGDDGAMQLDIAHLIEHKNLQKYQNKLQLAARQLKDCDVALSGPWPPYHFVHRLTRGAHAPAQHPATQPGTATVRTASPQMEPALATV